MKPIQLSIIILVAVILGVSALIYFVIGKPIQIINSFEACAKAGYPIMESYPEQCRTPEGQTFVRVIPDATSDLIQVTTPTNGAVVKGPLLVTGVARGTWYFEASFPVKLLDANGKVIAQTPAQAKSDWMTTEFVPFEATLSFAPPIAGEGTLVLEKDNPSGMVENHKEIRIPVKFGAGVVSKSTTFGSSNTLTIGETVVFPNGLTMTLIKIEDSRCKQDVQCVWQGELNPTLAVFGGVFGQAPGEEVRLGTVTAQSLSLKGYVFRVESATSAGATIKISIDSSAVNKNGVSGYVHVGPTCPVERNPPDPKCADRPLVNANVTIKNTNGDTVQIGQTGTDGKFKISLVAGKYVISVTPQNDAILLRCEEKNVSVQSGKFTPLDISCDSGIR